MADLRSMLFSENEDDRLDALNEIMANDKKELVPDIIKLIEEDKSQIVRETASDILKYMEINDYFPDIAKMFESKDAYVRNVAIEIFGSKGEEAVPFLTSIMDHKNKEVRKLILDSLVATGSEYAIPALEAALEDKAPNVKITAVEYLGQLAHKKAKDRILSLLMETDEPMLSVACLETLLVIGDEAIIDDLMKKFKVKEQQIDNFYKPFIFKLISKFGNEEHLDVLLSYLNYKNLSFIKDILSSVRTMIYRLKGKKIDEDKFNFIKKLAEDEETEEEIKLEALGVLSLLDFEEKFEFFMKFEDSKNEEIVNFVFSILCEMDKEKVIKNLKTKIKLSDKDKKRVYEDILERICQE